MSHLYKFLSPEIVYLRPKQTGMGKKLLVVSAFILLAGVAQAQYNLFLDRDAHNAYERAQNSRFVNTHTAIKPWRDQQVRPLADSIWKYHFVRPGNPAIPKGSRFRYVEGPPPGILEILPMADLRAGFDVQGKRPLMTMFGGVRVSGHYNQQVAWDVRAGGGYERMPHYLDSLAETSHIIHGWGDRAYVSKGNGYAWQHLSGYVSYSPNKIFNFQAGRDKHFWGDGYRSLFLSDASGAFPFLKINTAIWKLQYTFMLAAHNHMGGTQGLKADYGHKFASFHHISWNATKRLNIGIFESIVWQGEDQYRFRNFDPNYINPMVFFRPVEYSLGSSDNAMLGFSFKLKAARWLQFYGQAMLDEFLLKEVKARSGWWANKQGGQIGLKLLNPFRVAGLTLQGEMNMVRPFTYAHGSVQQNYGNQNVSLAHPQQANFIETVGITTYRWKRFLVEGKLVTAAFGLDSAGRNMGHNMFASYVNRPREYGNYMLQGVKTTLMQVDLRAAYLLYGPLNLKIEAGVTARNLSNVLYSEKAVFGWIGFRTAIFNDYTDY